ncbi:thioredoxin [Helicobacter anatolicus]|uniref:thioredoxin n=1 Tax=Helicobacter anatolicus TaxID=2905874 RepID=UPI001E299296|nr:thioredoxin [Helicobacter anatolicus]MCE3038486.1 thioredoxin [Helicobacter anatolicus]MCE3039355.1 thioredoxin [Helicobacter anatolicus]
MGQYIELTSENFDSVTKEGIAVVDFWAPWCGPCRMLAPVIDELANEYEGKAAICKVNTDEQDELSAKFGIRSIPTILFMKDGQVVDQMVGATSKQEIMKKIDAIA